MADQTHPTDTVMSSGTSARQFASVELPLSADIKDEWDDDPINPRNWKAFKKWTIVLIVSVYSLVPPLASSMIAPSLPQIAQKYGVTDTVTIGLLLSVFLIAFAIGPLVLAPLSEMYGRTWVLHIGNIFSILFNLGCAFSPNTGTFIAFRFLSGLSGSAPVACGGGSVADLFAERDRATAMSLYTLGPLLGPALGPLAGGYITQTVGVKYVFITIAGISALSGLFGVPFLHETYAPVIQARRVIAKDTEKDLRTQCLDPHRNMSKMQYLWLNLTRPVILLTRSLICFMLSLYMAFTYGIYYLMFATFADFFKETYGFGPGAGGLVYLGLGMGFIASTLFGVKIGDRVYQYLAKRNGGTFKPEMRIPATFFGSLFVPVGLLWYGWSAQTKLHWMMPVIGSGIFGFGMMITFLQLALYLVDAFKYGASALAAVFVFRSLLGFMFPLFASQMIEALGMGVSNTLLAVAILLGIPFPIWIYYYGENIRLRSSVHKR